MLTAIVIIVGFIILMIMTVDLTVRGERIESHTA